MKQLELFEEPKETKKPKFKGGSNNPIIFNDYEAFVAKFTEAPKTTDDCYTPEDVYAAVVDYVGTLTDMTGRPILRPFYPGGDYERAEYPKGGVVIDNPPFSKFMQIVKFYCARDIQFFLFGNGMTIGSVYPYCTAVIINRQIEFHNGAFVRINFATNLCGDLIVKTAPELGAAIAACPSQNQKAGLPTYKWPDELLTVSDLMIIAKSEHFEVRRAEAHCIKNLRNSPKGLFGNQLLVSKAKAKAKAAAKAAIPIELTPTERRIVDSLL